MALACIAARSEARTDSLATARMLHRAVSEHLDDASLEGRIRAVSQLQEAIALDPRAAAGNHWQLLGYVRELGGFDAMAIDGYRRSLAAKPNDRETWLGLGRAHKRQFLRTLDGDALRQAVAALDTATRCFPPSTQPWLALVPLLYEQHDLARAAQAAERSLTGHPRLPDAGIAGGLMAWRTGDVERADSLFRSAIPALTQDVRELFAHPGRSLGIATDSLPDPDPTTPENEVQLEYWSRVAHAYLLFSDALRPGLDARAETYIRYGPPAKVVYDPMDMPLSFRTNPNLGVGSGRPVAGVVNDIPLHAQLWLYPDLNMQILLHDRSLLGHWTVPALRDPLPHSAPDPAILSKRQDLLGLQGGFAVLPTLPPASQRIELSQTLVAFEGADGPRLSSFVGAAGETLQARWVVSDAGGRTVARAEHAMGRSVCSPGRSASAFDAALPPGRYIVSVSVRGPRGRRGIERDSLTVTASDGTLSVSELVPSCGDPALLVDREAVRLEPIADRIVRGGGSLAVYFEISHLGVSPDGLSRYTFGYAVERLVPDRRPGRAPHVVSVNSWTAREEVFKGRVRRQFISVPLAPLTSGRYRLTVTVRDPLSGLIEARTLEFERP
jgi:tetratricopeptide (TPR) repeat protein